MNKNLEEIRALIYSGNDNDRKVAREICKTQGLSYVEACAEYKIPATIKMFRKIVVPYGTTKEKLTNKTFPANPMSAAMLKTAAKWANNDKFKEIKNHFHQFTILDRMSSRMSGDCYKVEIGGKYIVDLRSEALLGILQTSTMDKGVFFGDFAFIQPHSQIRLVGVYTDEFDRTLNNQIEQLTKRKKK